MDQSVKGRKKTLNRLCGSQGFIYLKLIIQLYYKNQANEFKFIKDTIGRHRLEKKFTKKLHSKGSLGSLLLGLVGD